MSTFTKKFPCGCKLVINGWSSGNTEYGFSLTSMGNIELTHCDKNIETRTHFHADPQTGKLITVEYEEGS